MNDSPRIPISAYERWEMPHFPESDVVGDQEPAWKLPETVVEGVSLPTAEELEAIREEAYQAGLQQGKTDGLALAKTEVAAAVKNVMKVAEGLFEPIAEQDQAAEEALVLMAVRMAESIIRREISLNSSQLISVAKEAISVLPIGSKSVTLYVNPKDLALIMEHREVLSDLEERWQIEGKESVAPGGCVVETPQSLIDATIDQRFRELVGQVYDDYQSASFNQEQQDIRHPLSDPSEFLELESAGETAEKNDPPAE